MWLLFELPQSFDVMWLYGSLSCWFNWRCYWERIIIQDAKNGTGEYNDIEPSPCSLGFKIIDKQPDKCGGINPIPIDPQ